MSHLFSRALLPALLLSAVAVPAFAHVSLSPKEAQPGSYKGALRVPHGCGDSATTAIKVTIPEGVVAVRPQPKAGWTLALERGAYAKAYPVHGKPVSEGVKTITWSGGNLPDAYFDEFVFIASVTADVAGQALAFPVLQTCESGATEWSEVAVAGQSARHPAPVLTVAAQDAHAAHAAAPAAQKAGDITIEQPWMRATPGGAKVAGGYLKLTNAGSSDDRLVSLTTEVAGRPEIHEMAMTDGVMTMRELPKGLDIPAGKSVELAPGGLHLMLMDLKRPLKQGEQVKATLVFQKAGKVDVTFDVRGIGAGAPAAPAAGGEHHHH
ncbi:DUF1775 domain-containing protein [Xanthobacteraceae bacterium A53D]